MRVAFSTLGCRLNQFETDSIATQFQEAGYEIVDFSDAYMVVQQKFIARIDDDRFSNKDDVVNDPEVRRRLTRILAGAQTHVVAHEVATRLDGSPLSARIFVAREGVEVLTGSALTRARAYLRALEAYAAEEKR